jgi:hypothetical protein
MPPIATILFLTKVHKILCFCFLITTLILKSKQIVSGTVTIGGEIVQNMSLDTLRNFAALVPQVVSDA